MWRYAKWNISVVRGYVRTKLYYTIAINDITVNALAAEMPLCIIIREIIKAADSDSFPQGAFCQL